MTVLLTATRPARSARTAGGPAGRRALRWRAAPAAAVLLLGVLGGCTAADPGAEEPTGSPEPTLPADLTSPSADPTPTTPPPDLDKVETADPTQEQVDAYLDGRVDEGVDPAAVLEAGTEACARMHYLEVVDAEALRTALTDTGEGGEQWQDAVTHLCPDLTEFLP